VVLEERLETPCIYHLFPTRFADRDWIADRLREAGIETGVHYDRAVHEHAAWEDHALRHGDLPIAEAWAAQELSLPMHSDLTRMEVSRVAHAIETAQMGRTGRK
jgi:dTDP-4-amino-4,6-dideoxygalactose transaminase